MWKFLVKFVLSDDMPNDFTNYGGGFCGNIDCKDSDHLRLPTMSLSHCRRLSGAMSKNGCRKQQVDLSKEKMGHISHGQGDAKTHISHGQVQKKGTRERSSKNALSHTTLVGLDCGKFLVLATDGRTTEPNGKIDRNNFVKHIEINELVYLIYAGDNKDAVDYVERLQGLLKGTTDKDVDQDADKDVDQVADKDVDQVAAVAQKLLAKIWTEKHESNISEMPKESEDEQMTAADNVDEGNKTPTLECLMHVILGGYSSLSSTGFSLYTIDEVGGFCTLRRVNMAFGGCGCECAVAYALDEGILDTTSKGITGEEKGLDFEDKKAVESFVLNVITAAGCTEWRSGGNIHIMFIYKGRGRGKPKQICLEKLAFAQDNPKYCKSPYRLMANTFTLKYLKPRLVAKDLID